MKLNVRPAHDGEESAVAAEPAAEPAGAGSKESGAHGNVTVVGILWRILDALKEAGLVRTEKDKDGDKTSPLARKRFGLSFQQAQRGNGASV